MALTELTTRAEQGIQAPEVCVEVHISNGLPAFSIVGLPEAAVRESRDRVRSAIINSGFEFPTRKITVNLAPADLPKEGGRYDLAIALGILASSQQIKTTLLNQFTYFAELALSGELRPVNGLIPALIACQQANQKVILGQHNIEEAACVGPLEAKSARDLTEVCLYLNGGEELTRVDSYNLGTDTNYAMDMAEVLGQPHAKRAIEIAAAGNHHLLMMGPPGTGKSMLAHRLITVMPTLSEQEALQTLSIHSISGQGDIDINNWKTRPFRSPHHTVSPIALVGGGSPPKPGEISLAHNGVLFLDELTEFNRKTLEVLREPLETGMIHISRAARQVCYPADFQLVGAMNPCPGGCDSIEACECTAEQLSRYRNKLSSPFLDRMDMLIELPRINKEDLLHQKIKDQESSQEVRQRVCQAHAKQIKRQGCLNGRLNNRQLESICRLDTPSIALLNRAMEKLKLSARSYHRVLKLSQTIADLSGLEHITTDCIGEAIGFRRVSHY